MRQRIDLEKCWRIAKTEAAFSLKMYGDTILPRLPLDCPVSIDDIFEKTLDVDAMMLRLANSAGAPQPRPP